MEIKRFIKTHSQRLFYFILEFDAILFIATFVFFLVMYSKITTLTTQVSDYSIKQAKTAKQLEAANKAIVNLKSEDQYVTNRNLEKEIDNIQTTYKKTVSSYEKLLDLKTISKTTTSEDKLLAQAIDYLSQRNYASADATLDTMNKQIDDDKAKIVASFVIPVNTPSSNVAPGSGFSTQQVTSDTGTFLVYLIAGDISSTRVIVDTASDSDCGNNCPVLSLATYAARNGAYAGINGSYFCPASYPSCAGKTNSFDLLVMNKNKHYFNSDNNVYSTNPAVIFGGGFVRFVGQALEWGRDTGVDGVLSNFPMLVQGGNIVYGGSSDPKINSQGAKGFVANKENTVYIGFVMNATMNDSAHVMKTLGMENAMNLDEGGSTALWYGGYKLGPGRDLANAILFVRK